VIPERLFSKISCYRSLVEELNLNGCDINDEGAVVVAVALTENTSLRKLCMIYNTTVTAAGWIECFQALMDSPALRLVKLDLSGNNIDDFGAALLARVLAKISTLDSFSLIESPFITSNGWSAFADVLQPSEASNLTELHLGRQLGLDFQRIAVDDDVVVCFASALAKNARLKIFRFLGYDISDSGWSALADALCDRSSIIDTYYSNHALQDFCCPRKHPDVLAPLLEMNNNENKAEVARRKILVHHFADIDASAHDVFGPMPTALLPTALSWIGRDHREYSMMFRYLKTTPWMFGTLTKPDGRDCAQCVDMHGLGL
jgi:hypothetical protein